MLTPSFARLISCALLAGLMVFTPLVAMRANANAPAPNDEGNGLDWEEGGLNNGSPAPLPDGGGGGRDDANGSPDEPPTGSGGGDSETCYDFRAAPVPRIIPCPEPGEQPEEGTGPAISFPDTAWSIVGSVRFSPITIGMAPNVNPEWGHRRTYIGLPVWMWVADPTELSWGPWHHVDSAGGFTFEFNGQVDRVVWDMGDGNQVTCGLGTAYSTNYGNTMSPGCGHRYEHTSEDQPGGKYTVTATSYWIINWTAGGQSGTINIDIPTTTEVEVLELQSVNTGPNGP